MIGSLLILGFTLSLDNFRTAVALGALKPTWRRSVQIALGAYGLYLVIRAWRTPAPEGLDQPWAVFGLVVPLSADNVVAGTSLGLLGFSPWLAAPIFGVITAMMVLVGLQVGRSAAHFIRIRPDLLTGVALVV